MDSRISRAMRRVTVLGVVMFAVSGAFGQEDADPNSPTPVLYTLTDSARALAQPRRNLGRIEPSQIKPQAFQPGARIVVYAGGLQPMEGEGANAYRVFAVDASGHQFRYPVLDVARIPNSRNVFAITLQLTDEIRYWNAPEPNGDITIYLTWRGLSSNRVRLGLGEMGGKVKDDGLVRSAPLGSVAEPRARAVEQNISGYRWAGDRLRFLEQATFGPTSALDNRIRRIGLRSWLSEQFEAQYPSVGNPYPIFPLQPGTAPVLCDGGADDVPANCGRDSYTMYQPQTWFFREAFYGEAPLKHRVSWALSQMWVTSGFDVQQGRHMVEYHKVISNNAFGNYRNLMKQMTLNPTMGGYLDMAGSTRTNPNENYAREIMQLFSIGLFMLNQDGSVQVDTNGDPIPTYTQDGVNNLTKVLTGWSFCPQNQPALCPNQAVGTVNYIDPMVVNAAANQTNINNNRHDLTSKTLLSYPGATTTNVPACGNCTTFANVATYAGNSLDQAIDNIFYHPNVGPYVGRFMIQHLVTSDPTPAYISRVAAAFNDNGAGLRGDMRAVVRAVLLDPEARGDVKTDPNFGKLREPVLYATNILRAFNVRGVATPQSDGYMYAGNEFRGMAQVPFLAPTVFNFFPPDYGIPGTTLLGPEFAIMTTGTAVQRTNFVWRFIFVSPPVGVAPPNAPNGTVVDLADLQALAAADSTGDLLIEELNRRLMHGTMSEAMKTTLRPAITAYASTDTLNRARQAGYLVATSSQYQVQR